MRNKTMLKLRIITAFFLLSTFLVVLFLLPLSGFVIFVTATVLIGAWEWANLSGFKSYWLKSIYLVVTIVFISLTGWYVDIDGTLSTGDLMGIEPVRDVMIVAGVWWAVALLWVQGYPSSAVLWGKPWVRAVMGWLVLIPMWLAVIYLDQLPNGPWLILLLLSTVVVADTGAYFFGRAFGKKKLAVNVSPGKGDLLESMVKRYRDIKDSGRILPGHGGVMDRIDSITAAAPVFVLGLLLTEWVL